MDLLPDQSIMDLIRIFLEKEYVWPSILYVVFAAGRRNVDYRREICVSIQLLFFFVGLTYFDSNSLYTLWLLELISTSKPCLDRLKDNRSRMTEIMYSTQPVQVRIFFMEILFCIITLLATACCVPSAYYFLYLSTDKKRTKFFFIISSVYYFSTEYKFKEFVQELIRPDFTDRPAILPLVASALSKGISMCMSALFFLCMIFLFQGTRPDVFFCYLLWIIYSIHRWYYSPEMRSLEILRTRQQTSLCASCRSELEPNTIRPVFFIHHSDCCNDCKKCQVILSDVDQRRCSGILSEAHQRRDRVPLFRVYGPMPYR